MNTGSVLAQFIITLSQVASEQVLVEWYTSDGTAVAGVDYAASKGTVAFAPGQTAKAVEILVYGRAVGAEDRSFFVEMLPPTNAILGASIGECIIHVDTTGSTPVTQIIVPSGPQGVDGKSAYQVWLDLGNTGTEQDFIDSLSPSPEEIAEEVAPLLDMSESPITADGTDEIGKPDTMKLKELARRIVYVGPAKIAAAILAGGDNLIGQSDMTGDVLDMSSVGIYPRIFRGGVSFSPKWELQDDGRIIIKDAVAGDELYVCQYDIVSGQSILNIGKPTASQARSALIRSYADAGLAMDRVDSFEYGGTISSTLEVLLFESDGIGYSWGGALPKYVPKDSTPETSGGIGSGLWSPQHTLLLRGELSGVDGAGLVGSATRAQIRAYSGTGSRIYCSGRDVAGDGAGGPFYRDDADTASPDNGVTIFVDALGRRWKRDYLRGEISLPMATGRAAAGTAYTAEFEAAVRASASSTNGGTQDMRAGKVKIPADDALLRNAFVRDPGLVLEGVSNNISRLIGDSAGPMLTVHPVRGDSTPYTNTGYGGLFTYDLQLYAASEDARTSGIGMLIINCFNTQHVNLYVAGFKQSVVLRGSHFAQFRNFYAADEINSATNPNEEIFNRGYALVVDPTPSAGEIESTGLVISGGWIHNSSLDLSYASNYTLEFFDIEPASDTVYLGHKGRVHDCRFERMDYYAVNADPPRYAPFPWFHVVGDGNLIEHNEIHSLGATNNPAVNPKFFVPSNDNTFIFDKDGIRFGLIKLVAGTSGNHVEIGKFKDLQYFAAGAESSFYVENVHIYEGFNTHKLVESRSYVESFFDFYEVQNCASVVMSGPAEVQGLTKLGNGYTVDGSATHRIICNFNTTIKYTPGMYCLKFRLTGYSESITINIAASYLKPSSQSMPMLDMNGGYCFVRFQIVGTEDLVMPTININGASAGDTFVLSNIELLKFDSGEYVKSEYVVV